MLDKKTALTSATKYADAVTKEFSPSAVVFFGSYVSGSPTENSDIDVAVIFNRFTGDWQKTASRLWHFTWDIDDRIEPHLLDRANDPVGFVGEVLRTGEIIYQA
ncbi:MAG: nucleotidyltransferase domain-containing protein [Oscillospiraceae bacterium]|jgi:predicted nucleotidyltransferase|nr:nucleotidyltransferase domain-containing protein [Oscillospiraceae bacterium]